MRIGVRSLGEHARLVLRNPKPQTPMQKREAEASQTEDMQVEDGGGFKGRFAVPLKISIYSFIAGTHGLRAIRE